MSDRTFNIPEMSARNLVNALVVEDNPTDARLLMEALESAKDAKIEASRAGHFSAAVEAVRDQSFDVILLDLDLPDSSGLDSVARISKLCSSPIIVITSAGEAELGRKALQLGAQDFIVKGEWTTKSLTRAISYAIERERAHRNILSSRNSNTLTEGPFRLDLLKQRASVMTKDGETCLDLTPLEFKLLLYLVQNQGQVLSRKQILENVWEGMVQNQSTIRNVDAHISALRRKSPLIETCISSVYGVGYRFSTNFTI